MGRAKGDVRAEDHSEASRSLQELVVDYTHIGLARRFVVPVTAYERQGLKIGSIVLAVGDSVEPAKAKVLSWRGRSNVDLELLEPH